MKTRNVKTAEITGAALDWAVAVAVERFDPSIVPVAASHAGAIKYSVLVNEWRYSPSTDWSQGGPLIEDCSVEITKVRPDAWLAEVLDSDGVAALNPDVEGSSVLIAACRAIVAAKLGDTVYVPEVLV